MTIETTTGVLRPGAEVFVQSVSGKILHILICEIDKSSRYILYILQWEIRGDNHFHTPINLNANDKLFV